MHSLSTSWGKNIITIYRVCIYASARATRQVNQQCSGSKVSQPALVIVPAAVHSSYATQFDTCKTLLRSDEDLSRGADWLISRGH